MKVTPAQFQAARLRAAGLPRTEVARRLGITPSTVDQHTLAAMRRLGVDSRRALPAALLDCQVGATWRRNRFGWKPGDQMQITGGRYAGRVGTFVSCANSDQVHVRVGGGVFALAVKYLQRVETTDAVTETQQ